MGFEGEYASYLPLKRIRESAKIKALEERFRIRQKEINTEDSVENNIIYKSDLVESMQQPDLVLAIDGSCLPAKAENGFPGAEFGYVTVASVLIDLKLIAELEREKFIDPKKFRETEKASTIESVFPGCNVVLDTEKDAKSSMRRALFEELKSNVIFSDCETLLDTYEYLLKKKQDLGSEHNKPQSPIEGVDQEMTYGYGEYVCPYSGEPLFSTDALRLHELMHEQGGGNGEMFGQIMSTLEKMWLVHILRSFEQKDWLSTMKRIAFIMDGALAVFSTSSWLAKVIGYEIKRINEKQKNINGQDLLIIGIEKSGTFVNHFIDIDTARDGSTDIFPKQSALLLNDSYIKRNIVFSESTKPYGQDTYFGRKFFYKTASGQKLVPVIACYNDTQQNMKTARPDQFSRLADVMNLLDKLVSSRYPNAISSLVSAHEESSIPLHLGKRFSEDIAIEIREKSNV